MANKTQAQKILNLLKETYPDAKIALHYSTTWELLVVVILSAQSTDKQINKITKKLFKKYKTIEDYANADLSGFEQDIRSSGFFRNKAKNIVNTAKIILKKYDGKVPDTMGELTSLPGVARKTANVVLGNRDGIAVDTHVKRLSQRLGLSAETNPDKIEKDIMKLFDKKDWPMVTHLIIFHGRNVCDARKPRCEDCVLNKLCPSAFKFENNKNK
jgi:endonuclease-3